MVGEYRDLLFQLPGDESLFQSPAPLVRHPPPPAARGAAQNLVLPIAVRVPPPVLTHVAMENPLENPSFIFIIDDLYSKNH